MKIKLAAVVVFCLSCLTTYASDHPRLYVSDSDRDAVLHKIENHDWAGESYRRLKEKIDPYVERHKTDPQWIVSRLAMYWKDGEHYTQCYLKDQDWDRGEGNAPVPTVRMPGMRTWNKYSNVPLEERTPYNETGDMWGVDRSDPSSPKVLVPYKESGHMIRGNNVEILTLAEEAAFLYWLTRNEEYAAFAADIFNIWLVGTWYMNPILDPERSTGGPGGYEPGGICGYYDYEQIHDDLALHAAVIYDFAYDYLVSHQHPHLKEIGKDMEDVAIEVFKRFINIGMVRGSKSGNWNVNGWNMILRPILLLDDDEAYADGKGRSWYLRHLIKESTPYHDAIPDILKEYDPQTGLWPESPGYSFSIVNMLMEFSTLLTRCGEDIIADNLILQKAAMAVFSWMDEKGNLIVFGDSRGGPANFNSFEHLLAYYEKKGDKDNAARIIAALNAGIDNGSYRRDRTGWVGLCTYVPDLSASDPAGYGERISYSPHHRLVTMKSAHDEENLMAVLYGGRKGYHLTPNGLALQLYGYGYALAPDAAGYESYWSDDMAYHQSPLGSNTILPGYTEGEVEVTMADASDPDITVCEMAAGEKKRTVVMVKTGPDSGYYLDVFRSDLPDNDYLFHNVGHSVRFEDASGKILKTEPREGFDKVWSKEYSWFTDVESVEYDKPFKAVWEVTRGEDPISMHMWMTGASGRTLYKMSAPYTTLLKGITPDNVSSAPSLTPTIIVRQEANNAWDRPYVTVFEPCRSEGPSIVSVEEVSCSREEVLLRVTLKSGRVDHITCRGGKVEVVKQIIAEKDFRSNEHPRIFVTEGDKVALLQKIETVPWANDIFRSLKAEVDPILEIHKDDPGYVISRMQMHWEEGKRYTRFYTEGNFITRREGNAKYPTVRLTYARAASGSVPLAPLDKLLPYGDGTLVIPAGTKTGIVKHTNASMSELSQLGQQIPYEQVPFTKTGLGTETVNRAFAHLAWKSSILYYLTGDVHYAKLSADILWTFVRGASQQEQVNPGFEESTGKKSHNGYLSYETLGDTRHFATLPLTYDMIYNYLHQEYFMSDQFVNGIAGELWAPAHIEGKEWALKCFEIMFKRQIENKLNRGGALHGNWNTNEQQSAMLYALALDEDASYADGKGRAYYINRLVYGPTTDTHGAYVDVLRANVSPSTGLWPEAPGGYGQGSMAQMVRFGYLYYKNGIDLLSGEPLLNCMTGAMSQMLFPNGYVTNYGDASYSTLNTDMLEFMMAYSKEKGEEDKFEEYAALMKYAGNRKLHDEFYTSLFFYLPEIPETESEPRLERTSYSEVYSLIFERNTADDPKDALAFTLMGYGKDTGHRQPNGMNMELYGRGHVLAPDQGIGQDYWSHDTHQYKINVAAHNTVSPNGKGADNDMPQHLEVVCAEPEIIDGGAPLSSVSPNHQYVEASNKFYTDEVKADQRRFMSIVRTSPQTGYFVDIFSSKVIEGENDYHDYIYHNMGVGSEMLSSAGEEVVMSDVQLDPASGKGYEYFTTLGSLQTKEGFQADFHLGTDDTHMKMFMLPEEGRTVYHMNSLFNHRYYIPSLHNVPVPAVLVRQEDEAWTRPFVAVYEPYGNGEDARIDRIYVAKTKKQESIVKFTVVHKNGDRFDDIIYSNSTEEIAQYRDVRFNGTYMVMSRKNGKPQSLYLGNAQNFECKELKVRAASGETFNAYFVWKDGKFTYTSDEDLNVD